MQMNTSFSTFLSTLLLKIILISYFHLDSVLYNTVKLQQNSSSWHWWYWTDARLSDSIHTDLTSYRYFFVISQPAIREWVTVTYFHFIIKRLSFFTYHRSSRGFFLWMHCCKPLIQHPVQLPNYQDFFTISIQTKKILLYTIYLTMISVAGIIQHSW